MNAKEMIAVIQAADEGETVQRRPPPDLNHRGKVYWLDCAKNYMLFDFLRYEYRIKPEPIVPRVIYVNDYPTGLSNVHWSRVEHAAIAADVAFATSRVVKFVEVIEPEK